MVLGRATGGGDAAGAATVNSYFPLFGLMFPTPPLALSLYFPGLQCDVARLFVVVRTGCSLRHQRDFGDTQRADLAGLEVVFPRKQVVPGSEVDLQMFTFGVLYDSGRDQAASVVKSR
jgi:hypothetical protein